MTNSMRGQVRPKYDYIDIQETLKKQIGNVTDDDLLGAQAGSTNTIVGTAPLNAGQGNNPVARGPYNRSNFTPGNQGQQPPPPVIPPMENLLPGINQFVKKNSVAVDDYFITLDTRLSSQVDNIYGKFVFDPSVYLNNQNILDKSLNNVIEMEILSPFFIPKLTENANFIFERLLMVVLEVSPSSSTTSGNVAPVYHFEFDITDTGLGRFTLTPLNSVYTIRKPIRFDKSITVQFYTPSSSTSTVTFPPTSLNVQYASTGLSSTTFTNAAGAGFVVGDVINFSSNDPGVLNNPLNISFFQNGHTITSTLPLSVTISGAYTIYDGSNNPIPVGTTLIASPASRIVRIPFRFRIARTGDGNFIVPT